jgi:peptide/nickel transport system substrate-binding protein
VPGYVADPGFPAYDLDEARRLVEEVRAGHGGEFSVEIVILPDSENRNEAELIAQQLQDAGIDADIRQVDQTAEISTAISGDYDVLLWRNHPGEDPDTGYIWWHSGELTNFGKIDDPEIDRLLEEGRGNPDPAERRAAYEGITRRFAEDIWNVWAWYVTWGIATGPDVHGILGPPLPDGSTPSPILAGTHPTLGMWVQP